MSQADVLLQEVQSCTVCASTLPAGPRPVVQFSGRSRLVIIGQAPGSRVHASGVPWNDRSGERLRDWTGLTAAEFYDPTKVALIPMGFCYPGAGKSGDLPPRRECAPLWHDRILEVLPARRLTLLVGGYAQARYLGKGQALTKTVKNFARHRPDFFPLPHPSWRSAIWMRRNPWFEAEVLPELQQAVREAMSGGSKE
ncbi:Uracil-DNA glycosylase [Enhydrobacter aerosaccus]|uniref:Uracil-DNA glycosylase n=1 Tax=Enhydrobacter aerosaccus TaxID=225324 RepID=A0A1T4KSQ4_9HYPH|nr:uracil-DNA glycosylase family protein [Enhydrobacter aerosaccus]SJZ45462.1 Uracil-DNA glycosylase [Enhydrobacter aerosaccus]